MAKRTGALHVAPRSVELLTNIAVPLPPCTELSNVTYATPVRGSVTMRWSWSLRTEPLVTFTGAANDRPPSTDVAT